MSGYKAGEALWLARLQEMPEFDAQNSSRGKWIQRYDGKSDHYAVLKPGAWERMKISPITRMDHYQTIIQIWQRYKDHGDSVVALETLVDSVLDKLDTHRQMGDTGNTIVQANVVAIREMREVYESPTAQTPIWLYVELVGEWHEEVEITYA